MRLVLELRLDLLEEVEGALELFRLLHRRVLRAEAGVGSRRSHHHGLAGRRRDRWVLEAVEGTCAHAHKAHASGQRGTDGSA